MNAARRGVAAALAATAFPGIAADNTDLWWNPAESGWGMTIAHQAEILFMTVYVYGSDGLPTWFVGPSTAYSSSANTYSGPLFSVRGPFYAGAFNPAAVNATPVGTITYRPNTAIRGEVTYVVNGVSVTKAVERQTFRSNPNINGSFTGGYVSNISGSGCPYTSRQDTGVSLTISGTPAATTGVMQLEATGATCTFAGPYTQSGRMGRISGSFSCNNGISGTGLVFEIEAGIWTVSAQLFLSYSGCSEVGRMAAVRR